MTFNDIFSLSGEYLTYRDYWALTLGSYAGVVMISGSIVSVLCTKYGFSKTAAKPVVSNRKFKAIAGLISSLYVIAMFFLALLNGLFVFGGASGWLYLGLLLTLQTLITLVGVLVKIPYLSAFLVSTSNWCIAGSAFFLIQLPAMFDYIAPSLVWLVAIFSGLPLGFKAGVSYIKVTQSDSSLSWKEKIHGSVRRISFYAMMLGALTCGIVLTFFFAGTCITVYSPNVDAAWIPFAGTLRWNSRMMRSFAPAPCPGPGPCHVYLTAGSDLTSEVFINVHLPTSSLAQFLTINVNNGQAVVNATEFPTPLLDSHDQRLVFSAYVSGLAPGAIHSFALETDQGAIGETYYEFRTVPLDSASFVVAGDAGVSDYTDQIMTQMIATRPYMAVIGGDVAYDNGFLSCACTWDSFLGMWEAKRVDGRFLVPLSFAAGNHDLGVNDDNKGAFNPQQETCNPEKITTAKPLFFAWFPHETVQSSVVEPRPVCSRTTLKMHTIGGLVNVWILDSAYAVSPQANVDYVDQAMMPANHNVAVYHVPLYSSNPGDFPKGAYLRDAWLSPMVDKYGFAACFENHAHTYKRTKPMFGDSPVDPTVLGSPKGTVFLGDGKMGISGMAVPNAESVTTPSQNPVFEKTGIDYHFFLVETSVADPELKITVINNLGIIFDGFTSQ